MGAKESRLRSLTKAFSFRIAASLMTVFICFALTKNYGLSMGLGTIDFFAKLGLYYVHERAWLTPPLA